MVAICFKCSFLFPATFTLEEYGQQIRNSRCLWCCQRQQLCSMVVQGFISTYGIIYHTKASYSTTIFFSGSMHDPKYTHKLPFTSCRKHLRDRWISLQLSYFSMPQLNEEMRQLLQWYWYQDMYTLRYAFLGRSILQWIVKYNTDTRRCQLWCKDNQNGTHILTMKL